jgi:hypothetical protein
MKKYYESLAILAASAWAGGMWVIGYVVAPVLFQALPDKALAGMLASRLFAVMAYVSMACAVYLMFYAYKLHGKQVLSHSLFRVIVLMLLLVLIGQFGMQPLLAEIKAQALPLYVMDSPYADRFMYWHGAASIVYLIQSLLGAVLLLKVYRGRA